MGDALINSVLADSSIAITSTLLSGYGSGLYQECKLRLQ
jgi:hypothetical protein